MSAGNGPDMSALLDSLTSADDILRDIRDEELSEVRTLLGQQVQLLDAIAQNMGADVEPVSTDAFTFGYSQVVPADTSKIDPETVSREMPFDGRITQLVVAFPPNTQQSTGIQIKRASGEQLAPRDDESGYIALDGGFQAFDLRTDISDGEEIVAAFANSDQNNDHYAAAFVTVEERVGGSP